MTIRKRQNAGRSIRFKWTYVRVREGKGSDLFVFAGSGIRLGVAKMKKEGNRIPVSILPVKAVFEAEVLFLCRGETALKAGALNQAIQPFPIRKRIFRVF